MRAAEAIVLKEHKNLLQGITPSVAEWDTAPSDLANAVDGNPDNPTGTGTKTLGGAGVIGTVTWDLGEIKTFELTALVNAWSPSGGTLQPKFLFSDNNFSTTKVTYFPTSVVSTGEYLQVFQQIRVRARYIQFYCRITAAGTGNIELNDVYVRESV